MIADIKMFSIEDRLEAIEFHTSIGVFRYTWNKRESRLSTLGNCIATDAWNGARAKEIAGTHLKLMFHSIHRGLCREFPAN
jgi:hypothetical protein